MNGKGWVMRYGEGGEEGQGTVKWRDMNKEERRGWEVKGR